MKVQYLKNKTPWRKKQCRQIYHLPYFEVCEGGVGQWAVKEIALADCPLYEHVVHDKTHSNAGRQVYLNFQIRKQAWRTLCQLFKKSTMWELQVKFY